MKLRPWLSTCSSTICNTTDYSTIPDPTPKLFLSDATTTISDTTYSLTLHSNLSLQTLPSIPSLQKLSPETLHVSVSAHSLQPTPTPAASHVNFLAIHNHKLYAAAGNLINVFDLTSFHLLDTFSLNNPSSGSVKSLSFFNPYIFTAHQDTKIRAWKLTETKRHKHAATLPTLEDRLLRSILPKNYVNVRRHRRRLWIEHHDAVSGLAKINDHLMCSISWDRYLKIWNSSNFRCLESIKAHDDAINAVVVSPDGVIYTGSADRRIRVWGKPAGESKYGLIATLEKHKSAVNALALNDDGSVLFSGACDRSILVWEKEDSANHMVVTGALRGHSKAILCLINVSDLLLSGSADRTVRIWQRGHQGKFSCLTVLDGHKRPVRSLVAEPGVGSGHGSGFTVKVFSGSFDGEIKVWEVKVSNFSSPMSGHLLNLKL